MKENPVAASDGNMPRDKNAGATYFFSIKSKLLSLVSDSEVRLQIKSAVERVHEATLFFYKAFCLHHERTGSEHKPPCMAE